MLDFFTQLFDSSDFPARWHCGRWTRGHGYLHIVSDTAIFLAYITIPLLLFYVIKRARTRLPPPLPRLTALFIAFILFCGMTHLLEALLFYLPVYRLAGLVKLGTAVASWTAVLVLAPALPEVLALRTREDLKKEVLSATRALRQEREAKAAAEDLLRRVIDASPSGMLAIDGRGAIVLANAEAARQFGYSKAELAKLSVEMLVPEAQRERHVAYRKQFSAAPSVRRMGGAATLVGLRKDGTTFPLEVGLNPVATPTGDLVLAVIIDRTESMRQKRALEHSNEELRWSNEQLEGFASAASHDLKAPLRAIQNAVQWIEEDIDPEALTDEVKENFALLRGRAARMESLLNALLAYARAGADEGEADWVNPRRVVEDVVKLLGPTAERAVHVEGDMPRVRTARVLMERVMANLIANALKHAAHEGLQIRVRGFQEGSECIFEVADNGPGIDERFHARIFELFRTLRPRDEVEGAGMGLALVKKILEREGGQISVRSAPGHGATFVVRWPISDTKDDGASGQKGL